MRRNTALLTIKPVGSMKSFFDDDEYIQELFFSIHGTIFFTMDNQDDRSFLLEDENDFFNDLFKFYHFVLEIIFSILI